MINDSYGVFAQSPYLSQIRLQVGYMLSEADELGFWTTQHGPGNTHYPDGIATSCADWISTMRSGIITIHAPAPTSGCGSDYLSHHRLDGDGSLGQLIFGSSGACRSASTRSSMPARRT